MLKDEYMQKWKDICQHSSKLSNYILFKSNFETDAYFSVLDVKRFRYALLCFRCFHQVMIEKERYLGIDRDQRLCFKCKYDIEDEFHFIIICPHYKENRTRYIAKKY